MATKSTPTLHRGNLAVLVVGTIAALGCALGPLWLVRVGVGIAVAMALVSTLLTWQQMKRMVTEHLAEVSRLRAEHDAQVRAVSHAHHVESMETIARFTARKKNFVEQIGAAQAEIAELRAGLAASALDNEAKQTRISALNKRVADLELELVADGGPLELPRRAGRGLDVASRPLVYPAQERKQA